MYKISLLLLSVSSPIYSALGPVLQCAKRLPVVVSMGAVQQPSILVQQRSMSSGEPSLHNYIAFAQELRKTMPNNDEAVKRLMRKLPVERLHQSMPEDEKAEWEVCRRTIALQAVIDPASIHPNDVQRAMKKEDHELLNLLFSSQAFAIQSSQKSPSVDLLMESNLGGSFRLVFSLMQLREKCASTMKKWVENRSKQMHAHRCLWIHEKARFFGKVPDDDIIFAVEHANNALIMTLLECGANPNADGAWQKWGFEQILLRAFRKCDAAAVKMLLDAGAKIYTPHHSIKNIIYRKYGSLSDRIKKIMLLVNFCKDSELNSLIFSASVHFPEFKEYFESALVVHNEASTASEKEAARDKILSFMLEHGIKEEEVTIARKTESKSSRVQEAD